MKNLSFSQALINSLQKVFKLQPKVWIVSITLAFISALCNIPDYIDTMHTAQQARNFASNKGLNIVPENESLARGVVDKFNLDDSFMSYILGVACIGLVIFFIIMIISFIVQSLIYYYMYYHSYEAVFGDKPEGKVSIGTVTSVSVVIGLKVALGLILFIIPGIICSLKYAPVTYVLCKYPNLSHDEILAKCREISDNYKGKIFGYTLLLGLVIGIVISIPSAIFTILLTLSQSFVMIFVLVCFSTITSSISMILGVLFGLYLYNGIEEDKKIA